MSEAPAFTGRLAAYRAVAAFAAAAIIATAGVSPTVSRAASAAKAVRWNYTHSLPVGTEYLAASTAGCPGNAIRLCIYAIGGMNGLIPNLRQAEVFDPTTRDWTTIAKLPSSDPDLAAASGPCAGSLTKTCVYALGGAAGSGAEMYDPVTKRWRKVASMDVVREDPAAAAGPCRQAPASTCIYAIGGGTGVSGEFLSSVEMYNPARNAWQYVARLHTGRQLLAAASAPCRGSTQRTCIYAMGGIAGAGVPVKSVEMYDPSHNSWTIVAGFDRPRYSFAAARAPCFPTSARECLYALGGSAKPIPCGPTTCYTAVTSVLRYDPASNEWATLPSLNSPRQHLAAASGPCSGEVSETCVYAIAGEADPNAGALRSVEVYGGPGLPNIPHEWTFVGPLLTERAGLSAAPAPCSKATARTCLYAVGGEDQRGKPLSSMETFDARQDEWLAARPMPAVRQWPGATAGPCRLATSRTCIYVIGGLDVRGNAVTSVMIYDPSTAAWSLVAPLPSPRFYTGAATAPCRGAVQRNCIYAIAGSNANSVPVSSAEMYDPSLNRWTALPPLPSARSGLSAAGGPCPGATKQTCVYAVGGYGNNTRPTTTVSVYDPALNTWRSARPLFRARYGLAATEGPCSGHPAATCIYALGGVGSSGATLTSVEMYNPAPQTWSFLASLHAPREQLAAAAAPCQRQAARSCVYAVGGTTGPQQDVLPSVETYQP